MWIAPHFWAYYSPLSVSEQRREPFEWIEVDQAYCSLVYGDSSCQAVLSAENLEKCFNTIGTCQRVDNYLGSSLTLKFCRNAQRLPSGSDYWLPYLQNVKIKPGTINPGGGNRSASALGTRATMSATLTDHPHSDRIVDPYVEERMSGAAIFGGVGYDPLNRSTFWRKWAARNLYKINRPVRYCCGYIDDDGNIYDVIRRDYVTTRFSGPTISGSVTIDAQDILANVHNEKAQCPRASSGKLAANITALDVTATLSPSGIGDAEYPVLGYVRIGSEVCQFIRPIGDILIIIRGLFNTIAADANAGETVQLCAIFDAQTPAQIITTLLVDYARIPETAIDVSQFEAETTAYLPRLYSSLITEPTGVKELLGEISEQMYCYVFFDERFGLIRLRAVRPPGDDSVTDFDEDTLIENSVSVTEQADQTITRLVINYAPRDYTKSLDEITNYRATDVFADLIEEGEDRTNGERIKTIFSRWLGVVDGSAATALGYNLLARYKLPPQRIEFSLDAKDRGVWVSDFVRLTTKQIVDVYGVPEPVACQVMEADETRSGVSYRYVAQRYAAEVPAGGKVVEIVADITDADLRDLFDTKFAVTPGNEIVTFIIRSGVVVGSSSISIPAVDVGTWPSETELLLINNGTIAGRGGRGMSEPFPSGPLVLSPAENGGIGLLAARAITIQNLGIIGGGGGGGCGMLAYNFDTVIGAFYAGAGGGGYGSGWPDDTSGNPVRLGSSAGGATVGGDLIASQFPYSPFSGMPGTYTADFRGGDLGEDAPGSLFYWNLLGPTGIGYSQSVGGLKGFAISGIGFVAFDGLPGDIRGPQV